MSWWVAAACTRVGRKNHTGLLSRWQKGREEEHTKKGWRENRHWINARKNHLTVTESSMKAYASIQLHGPVCHTCVNGHNSIWLKKKQGLENHQNNSKTPINFKIYPMLSIGSIVREEAQKKDFAGNFLQHFLWLTRCPTVFWRMLCGESMGNHPTMPQQGWERLWNLSSMHAPRHTVTQRFESSYKFITLNNWGILPTLQNIAVKNVATVKATPRCQQGQPTVAVVEAASPMCSLFTMLLWGWLRNPHLYLQDMLGATMKYKFINSRNTDVKHEHLE